MTLPEEKIDYLDSDPVNHDQRYCLLSAIFPESMVEKKELYYFQEYFKKVIEKGVVGDNDIKKFKKDELARLQEITTNMKENYTDFKAANWEALDEKFAAATENATNTFGIKIRGVFCNIAEAKAKSGVLQRRDPDHNVFIGEVGKWLPLNPSLEYFVENQEYLDEELNTLMKKYQENLQLRDDYYEQQKRDRIAKARSEGLAGRKKAAAVAAVHHTATPEAPSVVDGERQGSPTDDGQASSSASVTEIQAAVESGDHFMHKQQHAAHMVSISSAAKRARQVEDPNHSQVSGYEMTGAPLDEMLPTE